ncbi:MAG: hypothetical protein JWQ27_105 [Ferruginibacter sp.]|nr:hypothetical protein [Ferruginibacter sp.]
MQVPHPMNTVSQVLEKLRQKKMDNEFRWYKQGFSVNQSKFYQPEDCRIVKTYRFEGMSDPGDMSILYIIQTNDGLTGYSLDAYGVYSDHDGEQGYDNFIRKIPVSNHQEQLLFEL